MLRTTSSLIQALSRFFETVWLDLPAEAGKILAGASDEQTLHKAGWKAYDAWISLANELTNAVYSDPVIGELTGQAMESMLRFRHIGGAMAAAVFGNLWPSIGLPTHSEMVAVRDELLALREELAAYAARLPASDHFANMDAQHASGATRKSLRLNGYDAANGNGSVTSGNGGAIRRSANQEKLYVAA